MQMEGDLELSLGSRNSDPADGCSEPRGSGLVGLHKSNHVFHRITYGVERFHKPNWCSIYLGYSPAQAS